MSEEKIYWSDNRLRKVIEYQIEARGGKINPKDDFNGFINDIKSCVRDISSRPSQPIGEEDWKDFINKYKPLIVLCVIAGLSETEWNVFKAGLAKEIALAARLPKPIEKSLKQNITGTLVDYYASKESQEWMNAPMGTPKPIEGEA